MANTITTKYGTKINVDGLTPEQIDRVRAIAEKGGAYGGRGAALADQFRKQGGGEISTGQPQRPGKKVRDPSVVNPKKEDPGTQGLGDTGATLDSFLEGIFKNMQPLDLSGAPSILGANDLEGARTQAYESLYALNTRNLERNKARELEDQKQELANRGIPYTPGDAESAYGKAIGGINERYDAEFQDAQNRAIAGAADYASNLAGINKTAQDAFMQQAMGQFQSQLDAASAGGNILNVLMSKYGVDQQTAQEALNRKMQEKIARISASRKSGGGGGDGGSDIIIGGEAPGFGV